MRWQGQSAVACLSRLADSGQVERAVPLPRWLFSMPSALETFNQLVPRL